MGAGERRRRRRFDGEHDAAEAEGVRRSDGRVKGDQGWTAKLRQLELAVAVRRPHHDDVDLHTFVALIRSTHGPSTAAAPARVIPSAVKMRSPRRGRRRRH
jgi:hypothetical protein